MSRSGKINERSFSNPHIRKYQLMILILQLVNSQEYESYSDSEAGSIKDVDNMIAPPTWCMRSGWTIRFNTTFSNYILVDSSIQFL